MTKAAAILLMPVLTFLLYVLYDPSFISSKKNNPELDSIEVIASAGARTIVQLSDGTEVNLNYGSKIKYPRNFIGDTRELRLSGEGFFNVAHDPKHPFVVKSKHLNIKALGTKFNVLTYPENDQVETTLIEGKVVLEQPNENGITKSIGSLIPGEHVNYNSTTGEISITQGNVEKYVAWKDGILFFDNAGISDVAERLGRMYNVDIKVADEIKDYTYTVKFVDESLSQILDLLTKATPVNYKMFPREKLPDGTYSKQKILFEKR
jgi:ferric-dicitrate binding protein FerR (iron transport regulator)